MKDILEPEKRSKAIRADAQDLLRKDGFNELQREKKNTLLHIALEVAREPALVQKRSNYSKDTE